MIIKHFIKVLVMLFPEKVVSFGFSSQPKRLFSWSSKILERLSNNHWYISSVWSISFYREKIYKIIERFTYYLLPKAIYKIVHRSLFNIWILWNEVLGFMRQYRLNNCIYIYSLDTISSPIRTLNDEWNCFNIKYFASNKV